MNEKTEDLTIWYLREHRLFRGTDPGTLDACRPIFTQRTYAAKSILFTQGDDARTVYLVKRGKVRIGRVTGDGKEITIAILGSGDVFGEDVAFSECVVRTTRATVLEESLLCLARMHDLVELVAKNSVVALNMVKYLQEKRQDAIAAVEELVSLRVGDRIESLLDRLARDHGSKTEDGVRIDVKLTHAEIAALVGSARETVSVELARLRRKRVFKIINGYFVMPA